MSPSLRPYPAVLLAFLGMAAPVSAQVSDVQQCIWSCLYGAGGGNPASAAYSQCVSQNCAGETEEAPRGGDPTRVWQSGRTEAGESYAGIDLPGSAGEAGVYFFCGSGRMRASVVGLDGGAQPMRFVVDGQAFDMPFRGEGASGWPEVAVDMQSKLIDALRSGRIFSLQQAAGREVAQLSLAGSNRALADVVSGC